MTLEHLLLSLQHFLATFAPQDPQDSIVGSQMVRDLDMFRRTARMWTFVHAQGEIATYEARHFLDNILIDL